MATTDEGERCAQELEQGTGSVRGIPRRDSMTAEQAQAQLEQYRAELARREQRGDWARRVAKVKDLGSRSLRDPLELLQLSMKAKPLEREVLRALRVQRKKRITPLNSTEIDLIETFQAAGDWGHSGVQLPSWAIGQGLRHPRSARTVRRATRVLEALGLMLKTHDYEEGPYRPKKYPGRLLRKRRLANILTFSLQGKKKHHERTGYVSTSHLVYPALLAGRGKACETVSPKKPSHTRTQFPGNGSAFAFEQKNSRSAVDKLDPEWSQALTRLLSKLPPEPEPVPSRSDQPAAAAGGSEEVPF